MKENISLMFDTCLLNLAVSDSTQGSIESLAMKTLIEQIMNSSLFKIDIPAITLSEVVGRSTKIKKIIDSRASGWALNIWNEDKKPTISINMLKLIIQNNKFKILPSAIDSSDIEPQWLEIKTLLQKNKESMKINSTNTDKISIKQKIFNIFEKRFPEIQNMFKLNPLDITEWMEHNLEEKHVLRKPDSQIKILQALKTTPSHIASKRDKTIITKIERSARTHGFMQEPSLKNFFFSGKERFDLGDYLMVREAQRQKSILITTNSALKKQLKNPYLYKQFKDVLVLVIGKDFKNIDELKAHFDKHRAVGVAEDNLMAARPTEERGRREPGFSLI